MKPNSLFLPLSLNPFLGIYPVCAKEIHKEMTIEPSVYPTILTASKGYAPTI